MIALRGNRETLTGPYTTIARVILDDDGETVRHENKRTEYHRPTGYRRSVWVIEDADGSDLLLVDDVDAADSELPRVGTKDWEEIDRQRKLLHIPGVFSVDSVSL